MIGYHAYSMQNQAKGKTKCVQLSLLKAVILHFFQPKTYKLPGALPPGLGPPWGSAPAPHHQGPKRAPGPHTLWASR